MENQGFYEERKVVSVDTLKAMCDFASNDNLKYEVVRETRNRIYVEIVESSNKTIKGINACFPKWKDNWGYKLCVLQPSVILYAPTGYDKDWNQHFKFLYAVPKLIPVNDHWVTEEQIEQLKGIDNDMD